MIKSNGEIAYEAFNAKYLELTTRVLPMWESLSDNEQKAWQVTALHMYTKGWVRGAEAVIDPNHEVNAVFQKFGK